MVRLRQHHLLGCRDPKHLPGLQLQQGEPLAAAPLLVADDIILLVFEVDGSPDGDLEVADFVVAVATAAHEAAGVAETEAVILTEDAECVAGAALVAGDGVDVAAEGDGVGEVGFAGEVYLPVFTRAA